MGDGPPRLAVLGSLGHLCQEVVERAAQFLALLQLFFQRGLHNQQLSQGSSTQSRKDFPCAGLLFLALLASVA